MSKFAKCVCLINSLLCGHQSYLLSAVCCIFHEVNFSDFAHLLFFFLSLQYAKESSPLPLCWAASPDILTELPYSRVPMWATSTSTGRKEGRKGNLAGSVSLRREETKSPWMDQDSRSSGAKEMQVKERTLICVCC